MGEAILGISLQAVALFLLKNDVSIMQPKGSAAGCINHCHCC